MSIKIIARPMPGTSEPDLLVGRELHSLLISDHEGCVIALIHPPVSGWDHESLEREGDKHPVGEAHLCGRDGSSGFWVGSSEI